LSYSKIGYPYYKIGSLASSARLGFLYLCSKYDPNNIKLEWYLLNGTTNSKKWNKANINDAQLDAYYSLERIYFECKCQEIFEKKEKLSKSYVPLLKTYFGINSSVSNDKIEETLLNLKISNTNKKDELYYNLMFDVKQLFTHLCALIKLSKEPLETCTLKYIFFKPNNNVMSVELSEKYAELQEEIEFIRNSDLIKIVNEKYGIKIDYELIDVLNSLFIKNPKYYLEMLK